MNKIKKNNNFNFKLQKDLQIFLRLNKKSKRCKLNNCKRKLKQNQCQNMKKLM